MEVGGGVKFHIAKRPQLAAAVKNHSGRQKNAKFSAGSAPLGLESMLVLGWWMSIFASICRQRAERPRRCRPAAESLCCRMIHRAAKLSPPGPGIGPVLPPEPHHHQHADVVTWWRDTQPLLGGRARTPRGVLGLRHPCMAALSTLDGAGCCLYQLPSAGSSHSHWRLNCLCKLILLPSTLQPNFFDFLFV